MWERLTQGQDIPPGSYADLPARHSTLSAAIDWSFRLLTLAQAHLFTRLSVFRGGWTLDAAEAVCEEPDTLLLLCALQDASLVIATPDAEDEEQTRYAFLETVRDFSARQAGLRGEKERTAAAHASFYTAFAEQAEEHLRGPEQARWLARLETEHENLRTALDLSLSDRLHTEAWQRGARLAAALTRFWNVRGHWGEGRRYIDTALSWPEALSLRHHARLLNAQASFAQLAGELERAQALYTESLEKRRQTGDPKGVASLLHNLGFIALQQGDYARAQPLYEESLALERARGDVQGMADELHHLGWLAHERGDLARARELYAESLTLRRPLGDLRGNAFTLQNLSNVALSEGDFAQAAALQNENLAIRRKLGDRNGTATALHNLGGIAQTLGDSARALAFYQEALALRRELGDRPGIEESLMSITALPLSENQQTH